MRFSAWPTAQFPFDNQLCSISTEKKGRTWASRPRGIHGRDAAGGAHSAVRANHLVGEDVARAGKRRPPRIGELNLNPPDSIDMEVFVIHDIRNEGLNVGMGTPSPKYVAEFKRRAVELCSDLIPLRFAGYSFEYKV